MPFVGSSHWVTQWVSVGNSAQMEMAKLAQGRMIQNVSEGSLKSPPNPHGSTDLAWFALISQKGLLAESHFFLLTKGMLSLLAQICAKWQDVLKE